MKSQKILQDNMLSLYTHAGLSLADLAERCGIGKTTLVGILNGNHSAMLETLDRIAISLKVSAIDLLTANYVSRNWQDLIK